MAVCVKGCDHRYGDRHEPSDCQVRFGMYVHHRLLIGSCSLGGIIPPRLSTASVSARLASSLSALTNVTVRVAARVWMSAPASFWFVLE